MSQKLGDPVLMIEVTAEDIAAGSRGCEWACPLAIAVLREVGTWHPVSVGASYVRIQRPTVTYSHDAESFIKQFDTSKPVEPRMVRMERI